GNSLLCMDFVHRFGVLIIQHLQNNNGEYYNFLSFMSTVGDPRNIFHSLFPIYFPLWFHLCQDAGTKMIWVAVFGDWFNLILRPYWWVQETHLYQNNSIPLYFAGSPSGQAMGSLCVWYVMIASALNFARPSSVSSVRSLFHLLRSFLWMAFWVVEMTVCISRVFIATHLPHQVLLGLAAGMLVAEVFDHIPLIYNASLKLYLQTNILLLSFTVCFYVLLKLLDFDPLWSVAKAKRWGANPDWIHLDTTPFAGLWRNVGALFGLGLAVSSGKLVPIRKGENGSQTIYKLMCMTASLTFLQLYDLIKMPTHGEAPFYMLSFCKSAAVPVCVMNSFIILHELSSLPNKS
uniref:Glucose-6-phosphatase n=1 Tax=Nothobranchius furzeri TaxID=105023 RepID=A0A8C6Q8B6_NOTFU